MVSRYYVGLFAKVLGMEFLGALAVEAFYNNSSQRPFVQLTVIVLAYVFAAIHEGMMLSRRVMIIALIFLVILVISGGRVIETGLTLETVIFMISMAGLMTMYIYFHSLRLPT